MKRLRPSPRLIAASVAALMGAIAFFAARHHLAVQERAAEQRVAERHRTVAVLVARSDLSAGARLDVETVATRGIPERFVLSSAVRPADADRVFGRRLLHDVKSGEPIVWSGLAADGAEALSAGLVSGRRALTFPVDEVNAVSGMLVPGDVIDLLYTEARASGRLSVRPLLQNVMVLATGTTTRSADASRTAVGGAASEPLERFATITLEVTPEQAQWIVLAQRSGELTAVLRHPSDRVATPNRAVHVADLQGAARQRSGAPTLAEYVDVITGGSRGIAARQRLTVESATPLAEIRAPTATAASDAPAGPAARAVPRSAHDAGDVRARLAVRATDGT